MQSSWWDIIWLLLFLNFIIPILARRWLMIRRLQAISRLEKSRMSRVITLIHRQETISFFGIPLSRYLDMEDSEQVLRAIHLTPPDMPIDIILHTPGGLALAAEQIAFALSRHTGPVTVFVPHYAMSGGTIIALAADAIVMNHDAVLGAIDPALGGPVSGSYPATSILKALEQPNPNRNDQTLIMGDVAAKAIRQVHEFAYQLLVAREGRERAEALAQKLTEGRWTHDHPLFYEHIQEMGLHLSDNIPREVYDLMNLYPQSGQRPSVEYVDVSYTPPPKGRK